jgi:pimeloyl-ACP methyl ester carboxylesterase
MWTREAGRKFLAFATVGEGARPLVALHGFLGRGRNLTTLAKRLCARDPSLRVVLPDLTGHGDSPALPEPADLDTLAGDVLALARELDLPRPFRMIGHSLGGRVALAAALGDPGAVADVTLLDIGPSPIVVPGTDSVRLLDVLQTAPREAASRAPFREHLRAAGVSDALAEWQMLNVTSEGGVYRWRIDPAALKRLHPRVNAADLWRAVEGPRGYAVRCVRGGASRYVSDAEAARLEAAGATVDTLPGVGHFVHVDGLDALMAALAKRGVVP